MNSRFQQPIPYSSFGRIPRSLAPPLIEVERESKSRDLLELELLILFRIFHAFWAQDQLGYLEVTVYAEEAGHKRTPSPPLHASSNHARIRNLFVFIVRVLKPHSLKHSRYLNINAQKRRKLESRCGASGDFDEIKRISIFPQNTSALYRGEGVKDT